MYACVCACVTGIRSWATGKAVARGAQVSQAKCWEQPAAAPAACKGPGETISEGEMETKKSHYIIYLSMIFLENVFDNTAKSGSHFTACVGSRIWWSFRRRGRVWKSSISMRWTSSTRSSSTLGRSTMPCRPRLTRYIQYTHKVHT